MESSLVGNRYWVLRHGKSIPNERFLIVSSMENGVLPEFQLPPDGVAQVRLAGKLFLKQLEENKIALEKVRICYSPSPEPLTPLGLSLRSSIPHFMLLTARFYFFPSLSFSYFFYSETLLCKYKAVVLLFAQMMEDLRERYFGPTFELKSHDKYAEIWALNEKDPFMRPPGGESADDVVSRLAKAMKSMEADYQRCAILVVSHGDPLQMLQNVFHSAMHQRGDGLAQRIQMTRVAYVFSQHRNFALLAGELRPLR